MKLLSDREQSRLPQDVMDATTAIGQAVDRYRYPASPDRVLVRPLTALDRADKGRPIAAFQLVTDGDPYNPVPVCAIAARRGGVQVVDLIGGPARVVELFTSGTSGVLHVCAGGARYDLQLLVRHYGRTLAEAGFRVDPWVHDGRIGTVVVRKGHRRWTITDLEACTGWEGSGDDFCAASDLTDADRAEPSVVQLRRALVKLQAWSLGALGVGLATTVGAASVRLLRRHLPRKTEAWRPHPIMLALCRFAGGYRGGYVAGRSYEGPGYKCDYNRMYLSCLTRLPERWAFGWWREGAEGIFLCSVDGPGGQTVTLAAFDTYSRKFQEPRPWNGERCVAVLDALEVAALRGLGFDVTPHWGYHATAWVDLSGLVDALAHGADDRPRGTPEHAFCKRLGNAIPGKLGEAPTREDLRYANEKPEGWHPFVSVEGIDVLGCWVRRHTRYSSHQLVGAAAHVTAMARCKLYGAMRDVRTAGGQVLTALTDCLVVDVDPRGVLAFGEEPGTLRYEGYDPEYITIGPSGYAFGDRVAVAGFSGVSRAQLHACYRDGSLTVEGRKLAPLGADTLREDEKATIVRAA